MSTEQGFVRQFSAEELEAFRRNRHEIHIHQWLGGETISVTDIGESDYVEKEWYCQFCGATIRGEALEYSARTKTPSLELVDRLSAEAE